MTSRFPAVADYRVSQADLLSMTPLAGTRVLLRDNSDTAGQTSFLMADEARQIAVNFTRLPRTAQSDVGSKRGRHVPGSR